MTHFQLPQEIPHSKTDRMEYSFTLEKTKESRITVNGAKATLFHLGDTLVYTNGDQRKEFVITLSQGMGTFTGHISLSQVDDKEVWRISVRTVERVPDCTLDIYCSDGLSTATPMA